MTRVVLLSFLCFIVASPISTRAEIPKTLQSQTPQQPLNASSSLTFKQAKNPTPVIKVADDNDVRENMPRILRQNSEFARAFTTRFPSPRDMALFLADVAKKPASGLNPTCAMHIIDGFLALEHWETWAMRMLDSWGRPGPGIMALYPVFRGVYDECQNVKARKPRMSAQGDPAEHSANLRFSGNITAPSVNAELLGSRKYSSYVSKMAASDSHTIGHSSQAQAVQGHDEHRSKKSLIEVFNYLDKFFNPKDKDPGYDPMYRGKYCRVGVSSYALPMNINVVPILKVYLGISYEVCVPDSCSTSDVDILANQTVMALVFQSNLAQFEIEKTTCVGDTPWESKSIGIVIFIVTCMLGIAICTAYDVQYIQKPIWKLQQLKAEFISKRELLLKSAETASYDTNGHLINGSVALNGDDMSRLLHASAGNHSGAGAAGNGRTDLALEDILFQEQELTTLAQGLQFFSVYTNGAKILRTTLSEATLSCVHGVRFLSMCWIVLGHTLLVALVDTDNILEFIFVYRQKLLFMILANGFLCVDTFFVISGMMVGYVFQAIVENETRMKYIVYILHRFIRLSPALIVFGAIYICLWPQLGSGPNYPSKAPDEDMCRETWAYTLFYINNFLPMDKLCLMWTWYLSCDYQFYLLCPVFMIPLCLGYRKVGLFIALSIAAGTIITSGVISYENNMAEIVPQFITDGGKIADPRVYYNWFYQRPYCRMGPYIVGLLLGYAFQVTERKIKLSRPVVVIGWILSTAVALTVLFSPYDSFSQRRIWHNWECALYNAFKHTAFGMSVGWVVLACVTGNGGLVNSFLSWKAFVPFSRITYCTYLVHPAVLYLFHYSLKGVLWLNMWAVIVHFLGVLAISIVLGFFLSLLVESPAIQLERAILRSLGYY